MFEYIFVTMAYYLLHAFVISYDCDSCINYGLTNFQRILTHINLASFLWDIGKMNSPRCDAAKCGVTSGTILFAILIIIEKLHKKVKNHP